MLRSLLRAGLEEVLEDEVAEHDGLAGVVAGGGDRDEDVLRGACGDLELPVKGFAVSA